jgi:hypothetical protein
MTMSNVANVPTIVYTQRYTTEGCIGQAVEGDLYGEYGSSPPTTCTSTGTAGVYAIISHISGTAVPGPPAGISSFNFQTVRFHAARGCSGPVTFAYHVYSSYGPLACYTQTCSGQFQGGGAYTYATSTFGICPPTSGRGCVGAECSSAGAKGYLTFAVYTDTDTCMAKGSPLTTSYSPGGACGVQGPNSTIYSVGYGATNPATVGVDMGMGTGITIYEELYAGTNCAMANFIRVSGSYQDTGCMAGDGYAYLMTAVTQIAVPSVGGPYEMR